MSISDQLLPMRRGECIVFVEEEAVLSTVYIAHFLLFGARSAHSEAHVRVEVHIEQKRATMKPVIMSACCCFER